MVAAEHEPQRRLLGQRRRRELLRHARAETHRAERRRTRDEARRAIFRYIETWYNRVRRHSTLGYVSPMQYERQLQSVAA